ncbi:uncharacterized protein LOC116250365 [Nymphaea colorata]|nr:uncharacterized protein LOC116250365 [Nymphaea colorata]
MSKSPLNCEGNCPVGSWNHRRHLSTGPSCIYLRPSLPHPPPVPPCSSSSFACSRGFKLQGLVVLQDELLQSGTSKLWGTIPCTRVRVPSTAGVPSATAGRLPYGCPATAVPAAASTSPEERPWLFRRSSCGSLLLLCPGSLFLVRKALDGLRHDAFGVEGFRFSQFTFFPDVEIRCNWLICGTNQKEDKSFLSFMGASILDKMSLQFMCVLCSVMYLWNFQIYSYTPNCINRWTETVQQCWHKKTVEI